MAPGRAALRVALAVTVLAAFPAASEGAITTAWSTPAGIVGSVDGFPRLTFTSSGRGIAAWSAAGAIGATPTFGALTGPDDDFGPARSLASFALADIAAFGSDGLIVGGTVGLLGLPAAGRKHTPRPAVAVGTLESLERPRVLSPVGVHGSLLALAANARGAAAALFRRCRTTSCSTSDLFLAVRRVGRRFGRPVAIARRENFGSGAVGMSAGGSVLAAWEEPRSGRTGTRLVLARTRSASGRLGTEQRLGTAVPFVHLDADYAIDDRAVVAWIDQRVSEGEALGPASVAAAVAPRGRRFGAAQRLERFDVRGTGRYVGQAGVGIEPLATRGLLAAWTGVQGGRFVVRVAELDGTRLRGARVVSDPVRDTVFSDLASGPRGEAVVLGLQGIAGADPSGPVSVVASVRGPGLGLDAFGMPEPVSGEGPFVEGARAAIDPVTRRAVAVWRDVTSRRVSAALRTRF